MKNREDKVKYLILFTLVVMCGVSAFFELIESGLFSVYSLVFLISTPAAAYLFVRIKRLIERTVIPFDELNYGVEFVMQTNEMPSSLKSDVFHYVVFDIFFGSDPFIIESKKEIPASKGEVFKRESLEDYWEKNE